MKSLEQAVNINGIEIETEFENEHGVLIFHKLFNRLNTNDLKDLTITSFKITLKDLVRFIHS